MDGWTDGRVDGWTGGRVDGFLPRPQAAPDGLLLRPNSLPEMAKHGLTYLYW